MIERAVTIGDKTFRVKKVGLRFVHKEVESRIVALWAERFRSFIETLSNGNSDAVTMSIISDLKRQSSELLKTGITSDDIVEWIYSIEGIGYVFWMSIRDNHPEMTLEACEELIDTLDNEEFKKVRESADHAQGIGVNPSTPGQTPANQKTPQDGTN